MAMSADERLALIRGKIDRSKKLFEELAAARDAFFDPQPYVIESKRDPQTGFDVFNVTDLKQPASLYLINPFCSNFHRQLTAAA